jgi:hypothetical protein
VDLTTNGDSTGDLLTFHNELFDETNTDVVGSDQGECVRIEVGVSWECRWVNILEGGSITVEGPFFDAGASALAVTGGTRAYRGARGRMRLVPANETATEFDFISAPRLIRLGVQARPREAPLVCVRDRKGTESRWFGHRM